MKLNRAPAAAIIATLALATLTACGPASPQPAATQNEKPAASSGADATFSSDVAEHAAAVGRIAYTHEGGIAVIDANSLEQVADIPLAGFNRINPAGDGRHVVVSTAGGFQLLDMGTYSVPHGDHSHYYTADPVLTDIQFAATSPGHVVAHDDATVLFDDATGAATVLDTDKIGDADAAPVRTYQAPTAHHGVAVALPDGTLAVTQGSAEQRNGAIALDAGGQVISSSEECPGIHGEAVAAGEVVVFGCKDGALLYANGAFSKIMSPDAGGGISTQVGTEESAVVLGNYVVEGKPVPAQVALTDTAQGRITAVALPEGVEYSFRSLARDDNGDGLVLGSDGKLHVIDMAAATIKASHPVLPAWTVPDEWQEPRPTITMLEGMAYITDPAAKKLYVVHPATGEVWKTANLPHVPNEIVGVSGNGGGGAHDHEHEDAENPEG